MLCYSLRFAEMSPDFFVALIIYSAMIKPHFKKLVERAENEIRVVEAQLQHLEIPKDMTMEVLKCLRKLNNVCL